MEKITVQTIVKRKSVGQKIVMLTAYDYNMAAILDGAQVDIILVGDSAGNVFAGENNTLNVTMDDMIYHVKAVSRGTEKALIVADMPFGSFQISFGETFKNAGRFLRAGAQAVKIEGGEALAGTVDYLTSRGIPVMGHVGLQPQSVNIYGGFQVQGKNPQRAEQIKKDAFSLQHAGAFCVVLEAIPELLARDITSSLSIPSIGIGAGKYCDGQVLVINDLLGLTVKNVPRFVKQYANLKEDILSAVRQFSKEVRDCSFPEKKHTYRE